MQSRPASDTAPIGPREVAAVHFCVEALDAGCHALMVQPYGSEMPGAVQRKATVEPDGTPVVRTFNGRLSEDLKHEFTIPEADIEGANDLLVKLYPGAFSQVVEGLDTILRMTFATSSRPRLSPIRTSSCWTTRGARTRSSRTSS